MWLRSMATVLRGRRLYEIDCSNTERLVEEAGPDVVGQASSLTASEDASGQAERVGNPSYDSAITELAQAGQRELGQTILHGTTEKTPGVLIVNPLSCTRRVPVAWPSDVALPAHGGAVGRGAGRRRIPPAGPCRSRATCV